MGIKNKKLNTVSLFTNTFFYGQVKIKDIEIKLTTTTNKETQSLNSVLNPSDIGEIKL